MQSYFNKNCPAAAVAVDFPTFPELSRGRFFCQSYHESIFDLLQTVIVLSWQQIPIYFGSRFPSPPPTFPELPRDWQSLLNSLELYISCPPSSSSSSHKTNLGDFSSALSCVYRVTQKKCNIRIFGSNLF